MEHKSVLYSTDNLNDISVEGNCKQDVTDKISSTDYSWKVDYGYVKNTEELLLSTTLSKSVKLLSEQKKVTLLTTILASLHILFLCNNSEEDVEIEMMLDSNQQGYKENREITDSTIINTKVSKIMKFHDFLQKINFEICEYFSGHNYQKNNKKLNGEFDFLLGTRFIVKVNDSMYVSNSKILGLENNNGQFDFQIKISENTNRIKVSLKYDKNQVNSQKNSGILESFNALLSNIVLNSDQCLGEFSLLTDYEQQMLLEWNKTETEYPKDKCVHQLFQGQVELYPDTIAVTYEDKHISYSELNYKANQLAHYLKRFGVGPDVLVGIHMERSVDMIIGLLGILKAGGAYVPLDTTYPKERLAFMLEDSKVPILLTQERLVEGLPEHNSKIVSIDTDWINISKESSRNLDVNTTPENLAYIIYTSGSTGRPKGVCVPHKAINRLVCNTNYVTFQNSDKVAQASNTSFDAATFEIWGALLNGAGMVIISKDVLLAPREFATIIKKCKINIMFLTTALFNQFSRELPSIFNSMTVLFGGEAVDSKSVREVIKKGKPKRLLHVYGPTESTTFTTWYLVENVPGDATNIPIGRPIANTEIYVLNQNLQPLSIGVPGELYIGGEGVARGYLNQPELTEEKFILNPFVSDSKARLYKTGDLVRYLPDGNIEFLGRIDNQVKIRGFRIELGEIETIIGQHPAILKTVVLAQEQEQESNNKSLVAYVVQNPHYESGEEGKELQGEQTEQWEMIFDNFYTQSPRTSDPTFNIIGWNSSYTGEPIPEGEMQYWLKTTVERILDLKPQVALEIGCGTGMILNRIAPKCKHYYGTDISNKALNYIQKQIIERGKLSANVKLLHQSADNFQDLHDREFDSIIMNSVIQYFPSIEYLVRVLEESVKLIDSKGSIFLGDIRSLPLVEAFHTKVEMHHSKTNVTIEQFKKNVENRIKQDNELVIDPEFFYALQRHIPEINDVVILPKMGEFANELTSFRYDVVLKIGTEPVLKTNYPSLDWNKNNLSLPLIRKQLENEDTRILEINNIKDARVNKDILLIDLLKNNLEIKTVADLRTLLEKENEDIGLNPEDFWRMAAELSYDVEIKLSEPVISGRFNIIFKRQGLIEPLNQNQIRTNNIKREVKSWKIYSNNPLQKKFVNTVVPEIKSYLKSKLPDYMIPTYFVLMDRFSLTPNGKVDRSKLPIPSRERIDSESTDYCMPRNPIEELVAGIWTELLNVNKIGIYENFFDLGGHSLLATQIVSRLRNILQIEVTVRSIFDAPSIAGLSEKIYALMGVEYKNQIPQTTINETEIKRPLSFAQQRLLFLEEFTSGKSLYSIPVALRLKGPLNVKVLQQSLNEITRRHQALRTVFDNIKGEQVQIIKPHQGFNLSIKDFTEYPKEQRDLLVKQFIKSEVIRPFDLVQGPLFRTYLIYVDKTEYVLLLNMHHIISDGWSMGVLAKELFTLYEAFSIGDESPLPDLPIQYVDYAVWQREWLKEEVLEHQLAYWKKQLSGELPILDLSTNLTRPTAATFRGKVEKFILSEKLTEDLKKLSRQEGTTLFMTLLAAFKALIYRYTSEEDILIGAPIANRNWGEIEKLIGFFVNTLTLRTKLSDDLTFIELMKRVREVSLDAYANQDVPFEKVVEELQPERNINQSPLFQVMFQLTPEYNFKLSNLTVDPLEVHTETAKFDLYLPMTEEGNQLVGRLEYNSDVFSLIRIKQIIKHFEILLEGIVCNPSQAIKDIPLLSEHENDTLLNWNNTLTPYPKEKCFHELFEEQVEKTPDAIAVSFEEEKLTYRELNNRANQLAHYLKKQGIGPEVLVGICLERSCEMIIGILGIHKVGGAYVPIDPTYPKDRIAYMLKDSQVSLLLTQQKLIPLFSQLNENVICLDRQWEEISQESKNNFVSKVTSNNLAYVIYTSGSTGRPKGVMIQHYSLTNYLVWCIKEYDVTHGGGTIVHSSLSFDLTITSIFPSLLVGKEVMLIPESADIEAFGEIIKGSKSLSLLKITPAHLKLLSQQLKPEEFAGKAHTIVIGGEPLFEENTALWRKYAPNTRLINEYGPTETVVGCSTYEVSSDTSISGQVPIGRPISNAQIYILDKNLQQVPVGVKGEIYIGGEGVARGYLNQPELTTEKFIIDSFSGRQGARLYKTGDLGRYLRDGNIEFLGRMDDQVKVRGYRIELGEIETLLSQHSVVDSTAVLIQEDKTKDKRLVAYITFKENQVLSSNELREYLRGYLPEYMIPSVFEKLDTMPLTINGKIDRKRLPKARVERPDLEVNYVKPSNEIEEKIASAWSEVLEIEKIGIYDNFFVLGGHSLLAMQVTSRLRNTLQVEIQLMDFFKAPTIFEMSEKIKRMNNKIIKNSIKPISRETYLQKRPNI